MEAGTDLYFCIVTYIQAKITTAEKILKAESWFYPSIVDWIEAELNASRYSWIQ